MSSRVCLIDLPGLSKDLLQYVPAQSELGKWMAGKPVAALNPSWPAVTCSVQATLTTGTPPSKHGIVANGIPTFRSPADQALVDASNFADYRRQVSFWEQSNQFVQSPRFWQDANGISRFKTALLFFQHCMPGFAGTPKPSADIVLTPKPDHGPDGKLTSLCWSNPPELVPTVFKELGPFPLMNYWGPMAGIAASAWIAKAAAIIWQKYQPQLQLVYVPHLDYDLQRFGPDSAQAKKAVVDVANALDPLFAAVQADGAKIVVLSEYSIASVTRSIAVNQLLKAAGLLKTRSTPDGQLIDYERSDAFALIDHQIAHVYLKSPAHRDAALKAIAPETGIKVVEKKDGITHDRAGDLQLHAAPGTWFDYRWWDKSEDAPLFAGMVDIHRKPGYDPLELFLEPGTRTITKDATLIKGSHGSVPGSTGVIIGTQDQTSMEMVDVADQILALVGS
jgi:predicted AlkP superfamily pyrophosphatase or phosphodiesterase